MERAQRNWADDFLLGKVDEQPGDVLEDELEIGVIDVGQTVGVLSALDVHQRDELWMTGRVNHEPGYRQTQLLKRFTDGRVEQTLHVQHERTEAVVDRRAPQLLLGAEALVDQVVA